MSSQKQTRKKDKESKKKHGAERDVLSQKSNESSYDSDPSIDINMGSQSSSQSKKVNISNTDDIATPVPTPKKDSKKTKQVESTEPEKTKEKEKKDKNEKKDKKPTEEKPEKVKKPKKTQRTFSYMQKERDGKVDGRLLGRTHVIPKSVFARLVHDMFPENNNVTRITRESMAIIQEKTESEMANLFWIANTLTKLSNRTTVAKKDIMLAKVILQGRMDMNAHRSDLEPFFNELQNKPKRSRKKKAENSEKK